jgi:hypothetical protein
MKNLRTFEEFVNESIINEDEIQYDENAKYELRTDLSVTWLGNLTSKKTADILKKNNIVCDIDVTNFKQSTGSSRNSLWKVGLIGTITDLKAAWKDLGYTMKNFPTGPSTGLTIKED